MDRIEILVKTGRMFFIYKYIMNGQLGFSDSDSDFQTQNSGFRTRNSGFQTRTQIFRLGTRVFGLGTRHIITLDKYRGTRHESQTAVRSFEFRKNTHVDLCLRTTPLSQRVRDVIDRVRLILWYVIPHLWPA